MVGFLPRKMHLYRLAFHPRSAQQGDSPKGYINNERLEYLGDAVLDAIVADYLFKKFPEGDEGLMTKLRSRIVKRKSLDHLAVQIGIPRSVSRSMTPEQQSKHLYGNILEALVGAIYLDRGYAAARKFFIRKVIHRHIDLIKLVRKDPDYKSRIIEWAQKNRQEVVFESRGEQYRGNRSPIFTATLRLNGRIKGSGKGSSKKEAEQHAAKEALATIEGA